jgi:hypothetical protein
VSYPGCRHGHVTNSPRQGGMPAQRIRTADPPPFPSSGWGGVRPNSRSGPQVRRLPVRCTRTSSPTKPRRSSGDYLATGRVSRTTSIVKFLPLLGQRPHRTRAVSAHDSDELLLGQQVVDHVDGQSALIDLELWSKPGRGHRPECEERDDLHVVFRPNRHAGRSFYQPESV